MPYIDQNSRAKLDVYLQQDDETGNIAHGSNCENSGDLNYMILSLVCDYMTRKGLRYAHIADCTAALDGAKQEFYREVVNPYELLKKAENGKIFYEPEN